MKQDLIVLSNEIKKFNNRLKVVTQEHKLTINNLTTDNKDTIKKLKIGYTDTINNLTTDNKDTIKKLKAGYMETMNKVSFDNKICIDKLTNQNHVECNVKLNDLQQRNLQLHKQFVNKENICTLYEEQIEKLRNNFSNTIREQSHKIEKLEKTSYNAISESDRLKQCYGNTLNTQLQKIKNLENSSNITTTKNIALLKNNKEMEIQLNNNKKVIKDHEITISSITTQLYNKNQEVNQTQESLTKYTSKLSSIQEDNEKFIETLDTTNLVVQEKEFEICELQNEISELRYKINTTHFKKLST